MVPRAAASPPMHAPPTAAAAAESDGRHKLGRRVVVEVDAAPREICSEGTLHGYPASSCPPTPTALPTINGLSGALQRAGGGRRRNGIAATPPTAASAPRDYWLAAAVRPCATAAAPQGRLQRSQALTLPVAVVDQGSGGADTAALRRVDLRQRAAASDGARRRRRVATSN